MSPLARWRALLFVVASCVASSVASCGGGDDASTADALVGDQADAPPAALTWTSFASGFSSTYCAECHGAGDPLRDLTVLAMVRAEQDKIRCGVSAIALDGCAIPPEQFPIGVGPLPSTDERTTFVRWIDEGALE